MNLAKMFKNCGRNLKTQNEYYGKKTLLIFGIICENFK